MNNSTYIHPFAFTQHDVTYGLQHGLLKHDDTYLDFHTYQSYYYGLNVIHTQMFWELKATKLF